MDYLKSILYISFLVTCVLQISYSKPGKFFQKGYIYLEATQNFYKSHMVPKSWDKAKEMCELEGATLFYPYDEDEALAVISFLNEYALGSIFSRIFIGISKPNLKDEFQTIDGRPIKDVYSYWASGEPNNANGKEGCVVMRLDGTLNDEECRKAFPFVCKKPDLLDPDSKPDKLFGKGYKYLEATQSFYKSHMVPKSWDKAKEMCELEGAILFYPYDEDEAQGVISYLNKYGLGSIFSRIFIGISKPNVKEVFETVDGRPIEDVYSYWASGEPNNANGKEGCVVMRLDGTLNDEECRNKFPFICKKSDLPQPVTDVLQISSSKPDKFFRNGYKYLEGTQSFYKIHNICRSWDDAKKRCELEGATLFYANDEDEAQAVTAYWNETKPNLNWFFVGISTPNVKGVYETVDGRAFDDVYSNWAISAPNNPGGLEGGCLFMRPSGTIDDDECRKKFPFVCKKTEASLRWNEMCNLPDPEYRYFEKTGRCYKFHSTPKTWDDAYTTCNVEQSSLAVINSDAEASILVDLTNRAPKDPDEENYLRDAVHLGFKYDMGWKTIHGEGLKRTGYSKWSNGEHDGQGNKTCGSMFYNGLLNDISCDVKCFFICEHEIPLLQTAIDYKFGEDQ